MRNYRNYTIEDIKQYSKEVFSIAGLLRKLKLKPCGGNYAHLKKLIQENNIETDHWTGQGWNKEKRLKDWKSYTKIESLKKHLLKLKRNTCESCNLSTWKEFPIPLEIHHIDGDRTNNKIENLKVLCCNCHALTDNWRNKNNGAVVQRQETIDLKSIQCGFESHRRHQITPA